jgi:50S ribosomal subunit-associated GTPase HflX
VTDFFLFVCSSNVCSRNGCRGPGNCMHAYDLIKISNVHVELRNYLSSIKAGRQNQKKKKKKKLKLITVF